MTLKAMASTVSEAVSARLRSDCSARRGMMGRGTIMRRRSVRRRRSRRAAARDRSAAPSCSSWLTMMTEAPAASASANSRSRKASCRSRSSAEVGSSATISSGPPISARAAATRCCWPTLRFAAESPSSSAASRPRLCSSRRASSSAGPLRAARSRRSAREAQRQHHVVEDRAVGQQVEHLEDDAEVLGAEAIARRVRQPRQVGAEHLEPARRRRARSRTAG